MKTILSKEAIDAVQLTRRPWRAYDAVEVDTLLDHIAAAAEKQRAELGHLRTECAEYHGVKKHIAQVLLTAQQAADTVLEQAQQTADCLVEQTQQTCSEELASLQQQKNTLMEEIISLRQYKAREIERVRNHMMQLLDEARAAEPIVLEQYAQGE